MELKSNISTLLEPLKYDYAHLPVTNADSVPPDLLRSDCMHCRVVYISSLASTTPLSTAFNLTSAACRGASKGEINQKTGNSKEEAKYHKTERIAHLITLAGDCKTTIQP